MNYNKPNAIECNIINKVIRVTLRLELRVFPEEYFWRSLHQNMFGETCGIGLQTIADIEKSDLFLRVVAVERRSLTVQVLPNHDHIRRRNAILRFLRPFEQFWQ